MASIFGLEIMQPCGIWLQLGCLGFCLSGLFGDLLLIRLCLVFANVWMMVNAVTGIPLYPSLQRPGYIALDGAFWAAVNLFFHGVALFRLLWDERRITFSDPEEQQLWQFFYRRAGMFKLEFKESLKFAKVAHFKAGDVLLDGTESANKLMLVVDGLGSFRITDHQGNLIRDDTTLFSGCTFDIGLLNVFGVYMAFERHDHAVMIAKALTDCKVVFWDIEHLNTLATSCSPSVSAYWRNLALCQVGLEWFHRAHMHQLPVNGRGWPEPAGILHGTVRSTDFTDPLEPYEDPSPTLRGILAWLPTTLAPFLPPGMRHTAMPQAGAMARNRLLALSATRRSKAKVLDSEPLELRGTSRNILQALSLDPAAMEEAAAEVLKREPWELRGTSRRILSMLTADSAGMEEATSPLMSSRSTRRSGLPPHLYCLLADRP